GPDRAPGALRARLPQRHADSHRHLSRRLHRRLLRRLAADRDHLLARWPRPARLQFGGAARLSGGLCHPLHLLAARPRHRADFRSHLHLGRSAYRLRNARRLMQLSPLNRRRLRNFRANWRGRWSLWIFLGLFFVTLFSELIASDRPILAVYKGEWLFPIVVNYPEAKFGGFLATTNFRDPANRDEINAHGWMLFPPIRFSYDTVDDNLPRSAPTPPSWMQSAADRCSAFPDKANDPDCIVGNFHWLGTDDQGRDGVARLLYGFRISVLLDFPLAVFSSVIGILAGAAQVYFGGWTDLLFQRFIEIWTAIPALYLLLIISS